jgi:predicted metalloprotease with PDZ domain
MQRVLKLHQQYPANAVELRDKRGADKPWQTALEMPGLEHKDRLRGATTRKNCIHCHNIHDAENQHAYDVGEFTRDRFWRYPLPDSLGLTIDADSGISIKSVTPESAAARSGIEAGEDVTHMNGQAIVSIADMQWVLDDVPNADAEIHLMTSLTGDHTVRVAAGWKEHDFSWRGSMWTMPPELNVWTPVLKDDKKTQLGIPDDQSPLEVRWINLERDGGRAAHDSGLREGDVIVALNGERLKGLTPPQFAMQIKLRYQPGDELPLTVLRDGREQDLRIRLVR